MKSALGDIAIEAEKKALKEATNSKQNWSVKAMEGGHVAAKEESVVQGGPIVAPGVVVTEAPPRDGSQAKAAEPTPINHTEVFLESVRAGVASLPSENRRSEDHSPGAFSVQGMTSSIDRATQIASPEEELNDPISTDPSNGTVANCTDESNNDTATTAIAAFLPLTESHNCSQASGELVVHATPDNAQHQDKQERQPLLGYCSWYLSLFCWCSDWQESLRG